MMTCLKKSVCVSLSLPAGPHRFGQYHSGSVDSLEDALQVDPSGDLSDQHRSHAFGTQLFVHTQEINFHHLLLSRGTTDDPEAQHKKISSD